jgi:iron-sulfur cluster assembly protein
LAITTIYIKNEKQALSLVAPYESDTTKTIYGIKVAIDSQITATEELTLDKEENQDDSGLVLLSARSS